MSANDVEFGYQVTSEEEVISEKKAKVQKIEVYCENCDSTDVEQGYYCSWSADRGVWMATGDYIEEHSYCNNCEEECSIGERNVD